MTTRSATAFVLATANPDKAAEIAAILDEVGAPVALAPRDASVGDVEEAGATLEDNARLKAVAVASATGRPSIADDTGLEVDALDGAPGVRSARFAGEDATYADNCSLLLEQLAAIADDDRTARFSTVAIARWPDGRELAAIGTVEGTITTASRGAEGFGYDPVFVPDEGDGRTFAEMSPVEKHAVSHRGRAFRTLAEGLRALAEVGDC
jgi:XTP/dITP diphosphohydrolase